MSATRATDVLVVDDDVDSADVVGDAIGRAGHTVRVAYCGRSAVEAAGAQLPAIAFVDISLPMMNGYEVARHLRAIAGDRPLRLVALTGHGEDTDKAMSLDAGFDEHLVKPIKLALLLACIEGAANQRGS